MKLIKFLILLIINICCKNVQLKPTTTLINQLYKNFELDDYFDPGKNIYLTHNIPLSIIHETLHLHKVGSDYNFPALQQIKFKPTSPTHIQDKNKMT